MHKSVNKQTNNLFNSYNLRFNIRRRKMRIILIIIEIILKWMKVSLLNFTAESVSEHFLLLYLKEFCSMTGLVVVVLFYTDHCSNCHYAEYQWKNLSESIKVVLKVISRVILFIYLGSWYFTSFPLW